MAPDCYRRGWYSRIPLRGNRGENLRNLPSRFRINDRKREAIISRSHSTPRKRLARRRDVEFLAAQVGIVTEQRRPFHPLADPDADEPREAGDARSVKRAADLSHAPHLSFPRLHREKRMPVDFGVPERLAPVPVAPCLHHIDTLPP